MKTLIIFLSGRGVNLNNAILILMNSGCPKVKVSAINDKSYYIRNQRNE